MSETVKWILELTDRTSDSGKRIAKTLASVQKVVTNLGGKGVKLASAGFAKLGKSIVDATPKLAKWAAVGALVGSVGLGLAGAKLVADSQSFKDHTGIALKALLKSGTAASTAYKRMLDFANFFGEDPADALERFQSLLAGGFSGADAEKLMQSFGDLRLVTPNINTDALGSAFAKIRQKGVLELGDFQSAVEAGGLNLTLAYEKIGKKIGKNAKEVEALMGAGRFNAKIGLIGLIDAINERTNSSKAGEKLGEFANTTTGLLGRLQNLPKQFVFRMTADDSPVKGTLTKLLEQLDPDGPNGKKIIGALNEAFTQIGSVLQSWATPEGVAKLSKGLTQFIEAAPKILKAIGAISSAVLLIVDAFSSFKDNCRFLWAEISRGGVIATAFGAVLVALVAPIAGIGIAVYGAAKALIYGVQTMWNWLKDLGSKALTWGADICDGLWKGLKDAWAALIKKITGLVDLLPASVKKVLGIASPSKVFAQIGVQTMAGFEVGIDRGAPDATSAVANAIGASRSAAASSLTQIGGSSSSSSSSSKSTSVVIRELNMGAPGETLSRAEITQLIARGVTVAIERASLE